MAPRRHPPEKGLSYHRPLTRAQVAGALGLHASPVGRAIVNVLLPSGQLVADDIPLFLAYFLQKLNKTLGRHVEGVSDEALALPKH